MEEKLVDLFISQFGFGGEIRSFFAPGRVNLIGEHIDYNGGHVFPCALTIGTYGVVRKRADNKLRLYSVNLEGKIYEDRIDHLEYSENSGWTNYIKGVIWAYEQKGYKMDCGLDFLCYGNIPNGAGLSSSASLEVLFGKILSDVFLWNIPGVDNALICQMAENKFVGVNCGIMDQFAIAMGKKSHAIFLNTSTLAYQYVPIRLEGMKIIIGNTNKRRGLEDSKYNERRKECDEALRIIQQIKPVNSLGQLSINEFEEIKDVIKEKVIQRRAKHAVYENDRTIQAVRHLNEGDLESFGKLLNQSHCSLRDDYEVTGVELDTLVEESWKQPGVIGARMTGAGFGGCIISLVKTEMVEDYITNVGEAYLQKIGKKADFYVVEVGQGPVEL